MRIGIFSDSYRPYVSGVVTSICTFSEELNKLGHETFIFAPSYPNYRDKEKNIYRFFSIPSPTNPDFSLPVPVSPRITAIVKKLDLDVIHVQSPFLLGGLGARCARRFDLPLVFTYHTMYDQYVHYVPVAQDWAKDFTVRYSRHFCNRCDLVITPSPEVRDLIRTYDVRTPIEVIPTGVVVEKFSQGDPGWLHSAFNIPPERKICLFVGRLTREKNVDFLIKAFTRVKKEYQDVSLVIVAAGPLEKELKKLVMSEGLAINEDVIFTGFLGSDDLINAYAGADIFTFGSVTETQGIVLVEAMAAGVPVVAVRATGSQEMLDNGNQGVLTDYDLGSFSAGILKLLTDNDYRQKLSVMASKRAVELSSRAMAHRLEEVYEDLMRERKYRGRKLVSRL
ncbi:MAG: glycosyltransferase family 4 protein [Chitinophagales bacterium]